MLQDLGHECEEAADGLEGPKMLESAAPECVLLDLIMPVCTGMEFLEAWRRRKLTTPAIVLTSDIQDTVQRQCLELGAHAVLNKSPKESQLGQTVAHALGLPAGTPA